MGKTTTTTTMAAAEKRPIEPDVPRPKNYVPLTEGLTADEAEGVPNAHLDDAGRSRSATEIPRPIKYALLSHPLTADEAEGVREL